jgi:hypothetical protein
MVFETADPSVIATGLLNSLFEYSGENNQVYILVPY